MTECVVTERTKQAPPEAASRAWKSSDACHREFQLSPSVTRPAQNGPNSSLAKSRTVLLLMNKAM